MRQFSAYNKDVYCKIELKSREGCEQSESKCT
jgi:hypothetical protein